MTIHLQIVFSSEGSVPNNSEGIRPPVFHNGERISGLLKVSMNDSSTLRFDAAEIVFKGN
jgi:hypothetical protein